MSWKKLNEYTDMWEKPALGTEDQKDGVKFMALTIDSKSKNPHRGVARQIIYRQGSPDVPGYIDISKLVIVESNDLLSWKVVNDLKIIGIKEIIDSLGGKDKNFIGLEDPDIFIDENGKRHIYFTIAFRYKNVDTLHEEYNNIYLGHAEGEDLDNMVATEPVLKKIDSEIVGFKEVCPSIKNGNGKKFILTETFFNRSDNVEYSAISLIETNFLSDKWHYKRIIHDPFHETKHWCMEHSSPCRIFLVFSKSQRLSIALCN